MMLRIFWIAVALLAGAGTASAKLDVVASTSDLGSLIRVVGGDAVDVTVLVKGPQDPHFLEPRPSFIRKLHDADAFVVVGMDLEIGWAPVLQRSARNPDIQVGNPGYVDASQVIAPLEVPITPTDRSMGDVHALGNPHYLSDPVNGVRVARLLRDRLTELDPGSADVFRANVDRFEEAVARKLVGDAWVSRLGAATVLRRADEGTLLSSAQAEGRLADLGGWLGAVQAHRGSRALQDHRLWPYFARRFGLELVETLEPFPGIPPTARHLTKVVERAQRQEARAILASAYFDPRHARWVSEKTGVPVLPMAHQPGSREGTPDYLATIDYNVAQWLTAF